MFSEENVRTLVYLRHTVSRELHAHPLMMQEIKDAAAALPHADGNTKITEVRMLFVSIYL